MRKAVLGLAAAAIVLGGGSAMAQDARYMASVCANCHGTDGRATHPGGMPALAGTDRSYFVEQMRAFKSGKRPATIMHQISKGFTDEQILVLADYFSSQKK